MQTLFIPIAFLLHLKRQDHLSVLIRIRNPSASWVQSVGVVITAVMVVDANLETSLFTHMHKKRTALILFTTLKCTFVHKVYTTWTTHELGHLIVEVHHTEVHKNGTAWTPMSV